MKNTIIAVGLLGLSFWFYNESRKTGPDLSHEIPVLDISDGTQGIGELASNGLDAVKSKLGSMKGLELPDLAATSDSFKQGVSDFAANVGNEISQKAGQLKSQASDLKDQFGSQLKGQIQDKANEFANNFSASQMPLLESPNTQPPIATRQPLNSPMDNITRDEGLINALEEQTNWQKNQPTNLDNNFGAKPTTNTPSLDPDNSFASNPVAPNDSSYITLATSTDTDTERDSKSGNLGVIQAGNAPSANKLPIQSVWPEVDRLVAAKKFKRALEILSPHYRDSNLPGPQRQRLMAWLDALAGKVIFSLEDHLEAAPYTVGNESLADLSMRWKVPAQLIYNINQKRISNPAQLEAGTQLKIVEGPFHSEVDMNEKVLTIFLGDLYAGRYPIEVGISGNPQPGTYQVLVKSAEGHSWRDDQGNQYPPGSPMNGYGPNWIGLSNSLCIHQTDDSTTANHAGCIGVKGKGAKDLFAILGKDSTVKMFR